MLIWFLKQVQNFILKFPINGSFCRGTQDAGVDVVSVSSKVKELKS